MRIKEQTAFIEKTVRHIMEEFPDVVVVAIDNSRDGRIVRPGDDRLFEQGDRITVAGKNTELDRLNRAVGVHAEDRCSWAASRA